MAKKVLDLIRHHINAGVQESANEVVKKNKDCHLHFIASFWVIDANGNIIDDVKFASGFKDLLLTDLDCLKEEVQKEKKDYIEW